MYNKNHSTLYLISASKFLVTTHQIYKFALLLKYSKMGVFMLFGGCVQLTVLNDPYCCAQI